MIAGVISDTHGYFDERVLAYLEGVDLILHAGDVGAFEVLTRLGAIAPVFAVEGNNDVGLDLGIEERLVLNLGGHRVQVIHQLSQAQPGSEVIVHGHSHKQLNEWREGVLYLNPGAAGRRGLHAVQSIGVLRLQPGVKPEAELIVLGRRLASAARPRRSSR